MFQRWSLKNEGGGKKNPTLSELIWSLARFEALCLTLVSLDSHRNTVASFYEWGKLSIKRLSDLPKVSKEIRVAAPARRVHFT